MNFFQSVFSDDLDPSTPESSPPQTPLQNPNPNIPSITSAWTFGSTLMKTLASKSESVIHTYRRELHEFSSGLINETAVIREAAVNAVNHLPTSLEAGAGFAQNSLESVGQAIDDIGSTVTGIISQSKESILAVDYSDSDITDVNSVNSNNNNSKRISGTVELHKPYSRLDAQIRSVESDMNTYLKDPEDLIEFNEWKLGFKFDEKKGEVDDVMCEKNGVVKEIYREIVPSQVDESLFWARYFYKVYKVKMAEEVRAKIVKRAIAGEEDEELSWDVDEDDYEENTESDLKVEEKVSVEGDKNLEKKDIDSETKSEKQSDNVEAKSDMKTSSEGKTDKDSDFSVVSSQPSPEEDGWDEIEDIGSSDENKDKVVSHGSARKVELQKRLSVAQEDEDLTWDIEDDDDEAGTA